MDTTVFGAVPYEVYLLTGDRRALEMGASYADRPWEYLSDADIRRMPRSTKDMLAQLFPEEMGRFESFSEGLFPEPGEDCP